MIPPLPLSHTQKHTHRNMHTYTNAHTHTRALAPIHTLTHTQLPMCELARDLYPCISASKGKVKALKGSACVKQIVN